MKHLILILIVFISACASKDTAEPPTELQNFSAEQSLQALWSVDVGSSNSQIGTQLQVHLEEDTIYSISTQGLVTATSVSNNKILLQKPTDEIISAGITASDDKLFYASNNGDLVAIAKTDFTELWRVELRSELLVRPIVQNDIVLARTIDGNVQAIAENNGERRWSYKLNVPALTLYGNSEPVIVDQQFIILGSDSGRLVGLGLNQGNVLFETPIVISTGSNVIEQLVDIDMTPTYQDGLLYVSAYQNGLYAVDLQNGNVIWQHPASTVKSLKISDGVIYLTDINSEVWAVNQSNGKTIWNQKGLRARALSAPLLVNDTLVVADYDGYLHAISTADGRFVARKKIDSASYLTNPILLDSESSTFAIQNRSGRFSVFNLNAD